MLSTPQEAAIYIINTIKEISPIENHDLDEDIVAGVVEDIFYDQLSEMLTEEDVIKLEEHDEDDEYFREYCQIHIAKYHTMLEEIAKNLISEYLIPEDENEENILSTPQ